MKTLKWKSVCRWRQLGADHVWEAECGAHSPDVLQTHCCASGLSHEAQNCIALPPAAVQLSEVK